MTVPPPWSPDANDRSDPCQVDLDAVVALRTRTDGAHLFHYVEAYAAGGWIELLCTPSTHRARQVYRDVEVEWTRARP